MSGKALAIESVEAGRGTLKVSLTDGSALTIGTVYLPPELPEAFFCPGALITDEMGIALDCAAACLAAEQAALRLIARAEQCTTGLTLKLEQRKHKAEAVRHALARLTELGLVNDARFAELWFKPRISRGSKGPRHLLAALQSRGIDAKTARAALDAVLTEDAEAALLRRCLKKAQKQLGGEDQKQQIRFFLKTEGFSAAAIDEYCESE